MLHLFRQILFNEMKCCSQSVSWRVHVRDSRSFVMHTSGPLVGYSVLDFVWEIRLTMILTMIQNLDSKN